MRGYLGAALVASVLMACGSPSSAPSDPATEEATLAPTVAARPTRDVGQSARDLLATLPLAAGGETFDGVLVVDDSYNVGHPVDDVLTSLGKRREAAVSVDRWSKTVTISATRVTGTDGSKLLQAFVENWDAAAVIRRSTRPISLGLSGWELEERRGQIDVLYRLGDVVYLVSGNDRTALEAVLRDMPTVIP